MLQVISSVAERLRLATVIAFVWVSAATLLNAQAPLTLPAGDGKDLTAVVCTQCHGLRPIFLMRAGRAGWKSKVEQMVTYGMQLLPEESDTVIDYLAKNFGPGSPKLQVSQPAPGASTAGALPDGTGKDLIESRCTQCHDVGTVTSVGRTKAEWESVMQKMAEYGTNASASESQTITDYLSSHFGKKAD